MLRRMDRRWERVLREVVEDGVADGDFRCADPAATVARVSALLDGLSVATLVYRSVTRARAAPLGGRPGSPPSSGVDRRARCA